MLAAIRRTHLPSRLAVAAVSLGLALWEIASIMAPRSELRAFPARAATATLLGAVFASLRRSPPFAEGTFLAFEIPQVVLLTGWGLVEMAVSELPVFAGGFTVLTVILSMADYALWCIGWIVAFLVREAWAWAWVRSRSGLLG